MTTTEPTTGQITDAVHRHIGEPSTWDARADAATRALAEIRSEISADPDGTWKYGQFGSHCWETEDKLRQAATAFAAEIRAAVDRYDKILTYAETEAVRWRTDRAEEARLERKAEAAKIVAEQHKRRTDERIAALSVKLKPAGLVVIQDSSVRGRLHIATDDRDSPYLPPTHAVFPLGRYEERRKGIRRTYFGVPGAENLTIDTAEKWARRFDKKENR